MTLLLSYWTMFNIVNAMLYWEYSKYLASFQTSSLWYYWGNHQINYINYKIIYHEQTNFYTKSPFIIDDRKCSKYVIISVRVLIKNYYLLLIYYLGTIHKNLVHFETLHASKFSHNIVKRGVNDSPHPLNKVKEVSFTTLGR